MIKFSDACVKILSKNGWFPERHKSIDKYVERLKESGWEIFPIAREFLESLQNLPKFNQPLLQPRIEYFEFDCLFGEDIYPHIKSWMDRNSIRMYPIGNKTWLYLLIDEEGILYLTDAEDCLFKLGNNLVKSIEILMFTNTYGDIFSLQ
jgi:hypothetical protein